MVTCNAMDRARWISELSLLLDMVPEGHVVSYKQLAGWFGYPRHARLVGHLMGDMAHPSWYRVIRASGALAFAPGSANYQKQRRLLCGEGVSFRGDQVDQKHFWKPGVGR